MASNKRSNKPRVVLFDLEKDDDNFVGMALNSNAHRNAIKKLTSSRRIYSAILLLLSLMVIVSIFANYHGGLVIGFMAFTMSLYIYVDIKIKVLKVLERFRAEAESAPNSSADCGVAR